MRAGLFVSLGVVCAACSGAAASKPAPRPTAAVYSLPVKAFVPPQAWKPTQGNGPAVPPANAAEQTWYVLVDQYEPHQKATPEWQPLPAAETVELKMPAGSGLRCIAPPLEVTAEPEESGYSLEAWFFSREVLCSGDGFKTFSAHPFRMRVLPDGKRELVYRSDGWLQERAADGSIIRTQVSLRPEAPRREATVGPPRVLTQVR